MTDNYTAGDTDNEQRDEDLAHPLTEDNTTPFSPPPDPIDDATDNATADNNPTADITNQEQREQLDPTHPATDNATDIDTQQLYDEGLSGAAEAQEPNAGNAVEDYNPENDQRTDQRPKDI